MTLNSLLIAVLTLLLLSCGSSKEIAKDGYYNRKGKCETTTCTETGKWKYYKYGKLLGKVKDNKNIGTWRYYTQTNQGVFLFAKGFFKEGKENGRYKWYHIDGNKYQVAYFKQGKLDRICKRYHRNGKLHRKLKYKEGKLTKIISCFDKEGNTLDCGKIDHDGNGYLMDYDIEKYENPPRKWNVKKGIINYSY